MLLKVPFFENLEKKRSLIALDDPKNILEIVSEVANYYELTTEKLVSRDRSRNIARPRQIAMYLLREEIDVSLPQIGEVLGGRDHTTVMHAVDKIEKIIKGDPSSKIARDIMKITDRLRNQQGQAVL